MITASPLPSDRRSFFGAASPPPRRLPTIAGMSGEGTTAERWRAALRRALTTAMKERDTTAMRALRSAMSAIDNAEAPDAGQTPAAQPGRIVGGVAGVGASEVARRVLSASEVSAVLRREIDDRHAAADEYEQLGRREQSAALLAEAAVIESALRGLAAAGSADLGQ